MACSTTPSSTEWHNLTMELMRVHDHLDTQHSWPQRMGTRVVGLEHMAFLAPFQPSLVLAACVVCPAFSLNKKLLHVSVVMELGEKVLVEMVMLQQQSSTPPPSSLLCLD